MFEDVSFILQVQVQISNTFIFFSCYSKVSNSCMHIYVYALVCKSSENSLGALHIKYFREIYNIK